MKEKEVFLVPLDEVLATFTQVCSTGTKDIVSQFEKISSVTFLFVVLWMNVSIFFYFKMDRKQKTFEDKILLFQFLH